MVPRVTNSNKMRFFSRILFISLIILIISFIIFDLVFFDFQKKIQKQDIFFETMVMIFFIVALIIWVRAMKGFETYVMAVALAVLSFGAVANMLDEFFKQPQMFGDIDQFLNLLGMIIFVFAISKDRSVYCFSTLVQNYALSAQDFQLLHIFKFYKFSSS